MLPKDLVVKDPDDVMLIRPVFLAEELEQFQLHSCLVLESLLVPDHLDGYHLLCLVVEALERLTEAARA